MENIEAKTQQQLTKCRNIIKIGYGNRDTSSLPWLNRFCAEFAEFSGLLHAYMIELPKDVLHESNEHVESAFLCLTQVVCCIKHLERTLKAEQSGGYTISAARQHFLDRIHFCLGQLRKALRNLDKRDHSFNRPLEMWSFIELLDVTLDNLMPFCNYESEPDLTSVFNVAEENAEAIFASKQIRTHIDLMLSQVISLANVALHQDKRALSALCQKVLRECIAFENECATTAEQAKLPDCNRKLKAAALEKALYQLEDYMNEALLRLVYRCFLDFEKFSIEKLRMLLRLYEGQDESALDELIADFDVNIDRTTQIGNFAISFAPNVKVKTTIRTTLASFESLDACIIPALYGKSAAAGVYSELLEQHFNEEVQVFKKAIQEIIDTFAFTQCYCELLTDGIKQIESQYDKIRLQELVQMGEFLYEHFQLEVNNVELHKKKQRLELFEKFTLMLRECQAILICASQVDTKRILKRFKILRAVLQKFLTTLSELKSTTGSSLHKQAVLDGSKGAAAAYCLLNENMSDAADLLATLGITPSIRSVLYRKDDVEIVTADVLRPRAVSDSLRAQNSMFPMVTPMRPLQIAPPPPITESIELDRQASVVPTYARAKLSTIPSIIRNGATTNANNEQQQCRYSIRRRASLRTAMFKRQKTAETAEIYNFYKDNSTSLQITEILDQLSGLSSTFSTITCQIDNSK